MHSKQTHDISKAIESHIQQQNADIDEYVRKTDHLPKTKYLILTSFFILYTDNANITNDNENIAPNDPLNTLEQCKPYRRHFHY